MAYLFEVQEKTVIPNTETLLLSPFKEIWERDKSKKKSKAIMEFTYIEFMSSMKKSNPFRQYPEDKKSDAIVDALFTEKDWKPDKFVLEGIEKINTFQKKASSTYSYYMAAKRAAEKMQNFFNDFDITERNPKTFNPIYKPSDITRALNDTEKTLANLKGLEKKVEEELFQNTKNKADRQISPLADPESLR